MTITEPSSPATTQLGAQTSTRTAVQLVPATRSVPAIRSDAQSIHGTTTIDDVLEGDLVFCARPSALQQLCTRAAEPWRHVGVATIKDGIPSIIEVSGASFGTRTLEQAANGSTHMAVARGPSVHREQAERAAAWCLAHVGRKQVYAWDDVILAGFIAVTRRFSLPTDHQRLEQAVTAAVTAVQATRPPPDGPSYSCSAFIAASYIATGHPLVIDIGLPRAENQRPSLWELVRPGPRPLRAAPGTRISQDQTRAVVRSLVHGLLSASSNVVSDGDRSDWFRWCTPGDLWRSPSLIDRYYLAS